MPPVRKNTKILVALNPALLDEIDVQAKKHFDTRSAYVRRALFNQVKADLASPIMLSTQEPANEVASDNAIGG